MKNSSSSKAIMVVLILLLPALSFGETKDKAAKGKAKGKVEDLAKEKPKDEAKAEEAKEGAGTATAADGKGGDKCGFGVRGNLSWGIGKFKNENESIMKRTMNVLELNALPGYRTHNFLIGAFLAARLVGQNTEPSTVSNQNLKGSGYLLGLGGTYTLHEMLSFFAAISFLGQHSLSLKDISGSEVAYQKPFGYHLGVDYLLSSFFRPLGMDLGVGLTYSMVKYKQDKIASTTSDVSSNKRSQWNLALGVSAYY